MLDFGILRYEKQSRICNKMVSCSVRPSAILSVAILKIEGNRMHSNSFNLTFINFK